MMNSEAQIKLLTKRGPLQTMYRHPSNKTNFNIAQLIRKLSFKFTKVEASVAQAIVHPTKRGYVCHLAIFDQKTGEFLGTFTSRQVTLPGGVPLTLNISKHNNFIPAWGQPKPNTIVTLKNIFNYQPAVAVFHTKLAILNHFANDKPLIAQKPISLNGHFQTELRKHLTYKEYSIQKASKNVIDNIQLLTLDPQTYYKKPFEQTNTILRQEASSLIELGKSFDLTLDISSVLGNSALLYPKLINLHQDRAIADLMSNHKLLPPINSILDLL